MQILNYRLIHLVVFIIFAGGITFIFYPGCASSERDENSLVEMNICGEFDLRYQDMGSPAIGSDGTIYVGTTTNGGESITFGGTEEYYLYAINPDCTEKWRYFTGDDVESSPAIGLDGTIYVGSNNNNLHAIEPTNGDSMWQFPTGDDIASSPAIGCDGTIYVGSNDNNLYAIHPDGTEIWRYSTGDDIASSPAIGSDGTIYVGSNDNHLHAINPVDGGEKWRYSTGDDVASSPAIGNDGTIYVGSNDSNLHAINLADGTEKWLYPSSSSSNVVSSPAIASDGAIYAGVNRLSAIHPDGTEKEGYQAFGITASPAISNDGILYVGGSRLWSTDLAGTRLADSPWPMFRYDLKHSGNNSDVEIPASAAATAADSQVVISWDPVSVGTTNLYWSTTPGITTADSRIPGVTSPYNHAGLTNGVTYYYALTTENLCGESELSDEVSATPIIPGSYSVSISPGDGTRVNMCPDTSTFIAEVFGGTASYRYKWLVTRTLGAGFNMISPDDEKTFEICAWDSMTEGTFEVTVTDSNNLETSDSIGVNAL